MVKTDAGESVRQAGGSEPPVSAARDVRKLLRQRLAWVARSLTLLQDKGLKKEARIHDVRVASRRADAAMQAFGDFLSNQSRKRVAKRLRSIRKRAGRVRSCDVHLAVLRADAENAPPAQREAFEQAIAFIVDERKRRRKKLKSTILKLADRRFSEAAEELLDSITNRLSCSLNAALRQALAVIARRFVVAAKADLKKEECVHELRLAGKQLRYALELFEPKPRSGRGNAQPELLVELQDRLGAINDQFEIARRIGEYAQRARHGGECNGSARSQSNGKVKPAASVLHARLQRLSASYLQKARKLHVQFLSWFRSPAGVEMHSSIARLAGEDASACDVNNSRPENQDADVDIVILRRPRTRNAKLEQASAKVSKPQSKQRTA